MSELADANPGLLDPMRRTGPPPAGADLIARPSSEFPRNMRAVGLPDPPA